jgi:hypothetical protein
MFVMEVDTSLRKCGRCGELKPLDEFAWRRKRKIQRDSFCRPCRSAYGRKHYLANRQRYIDQAAVVKRKQLRERTLYLIEYFKAHPCVDCGEDDPVVLEFDHLGEKLFEIGRESTIEAGNPFSTRSKSARSCARTAIGDGPRVAEEHCVSCFPRIKRAGVGERATGLEPAPRPWKGLVQPLHHARVGAFEYRSGDPGLETRVDTHVHARRSRL